MWDSNYIIKFELGEGIIKAANSPDTRNMFIRLFGRAPQDDAQLIIDGIRYIRNDLASKGIILPSVQITDNNGIKANEFICYWGIEKGHYSITHLNDFFDFIKNKAFEYNQEGSSTFTKALESIERDRYQIAYDTYKKLYYTARLNDDFHRSARALTEVSGIVAYNGQIDFALQLAYVAIQYVESYNIVDQTLKCQAYLNMGSILKCHNVTMARKYFEGCSQIAQKSSNLQFLFFSLLGLAESYLIMGDIRKTITYYEQSLALVNDTGTAISIQKRMILLYKNLVEQQYASVQKGNIVSMFKDLICYIVKEVGKNLCKAAVFKVLDLHGSGAVLSIGTKYIVEKNIFNSPTIIGDNNRITK